MKMMRRICFLLAGDTGVADIFIAGGKAIEERSQLQLLRRVSNIKEQGLGQSLDEKMLKMTEYLVYVVRRRSLNRSWNDSSITGQ